MGKLQGCLPVEPAGAKWYTVGVNATPYAEAPPDMAPFENPLKVGLSAVRANMVPMVVLWGVALAAIAGYLAHPPFAALLEPLARWQTEGGWLAAFLNRVVLCGIVPGLFLALVPSLRPPRLWLVVLVYSLWGGAWGIACDVFFSLQAHVFGHGRDLATLAAKTAVDQLLWNVAICTPVNALFFPWVANDFRRGGGTSLRAFLMGRCLPMLVSNWIVFVPVTVAVYAFPRPLQVQLTGLVGSFWMLVALSAGASRAKGDAE